MQFIGLQTDKLQFDPPPHKKEHPPVEMLFLYT